MASSSEPYAHDSHNSSALVVDAELDIIIALWEQIIDRPSWLIYHQSWLGAGQTGIEITGPDQTSQRYEDEQVKQRPAKGHFGLL
jgi:hypothetical protein